MNSLKPLSALLNEDTILKLRRELKSTQFRGVSFEQAMQFFLTDGILPTSKAGVSAFLGLEDWLRAQEKEGFATFTATELKNKTGEILDLVLSGKKVKILKHGREIARMIPAG